MKNLEKQRKDFLRENQIHDSYHEFFSCKRVGEVKEIIKKIELDLEITEKTCLPKKENIFKAFREDINNMKVVLLGMDPYPQKGVATGLAFEVEKDSWLDKGVNTSLKNIAKLIYKTYEGKIPTLETLRAEITKNNFEILPPNKIFKSWKAQGVLLLNTALTVEESNSGSHIKLWKNFTKDILEYLESKNNNLIFLLWGAKAIYYEKFIKTSTIIKHNHPAICGNLKNSKDFMNGRSFEDTKEIINWLG